jgi:general secretion pathway protein J
VTYSIRPGNGFTLIELIAAMAIFSLLAVAMYGGTQWVMLEREIILERQGELHQLQRSVRYLSDDFAQLQNRAVRDELGRDSLAALLIDPANQFLVELTHDGWRNPAGFRRGSLQRVQYRLEDDVLIREYWPVLDRVLGMEGRIQELMSGVEKVEFEFLDAGSKWQDDWPPLQSDEADAGLPIAIRYRLTTAAFGEITRLVEVPR